MALLHSILDHHSRHQPVQSLSNVLGDGFLVDRNPIYKLVRARVLKLNVEFSTNVPQDVVVMPLGQLEMFLSSKKIFYFDNVKVLKGVELKAPKLIAWDSLAVHLKRNMIFHESCHFLARHEFEKNQKLKSKIPVLQIIFEESFANSCELLAIKDVDDQLHKFFFEFNSYIYVPEVRNLIHDLTDLIGFETVFRWVMISYIYSNFLYDSIPEKDLSRILKIIGLDQKVHASLLKQLKALSKITFLLNPEFKTATTAFYLTYHGYSNGLNDLTSLDFISEIENSSSYKETLYHLSRFWVFN